MRCRRSRVKWVCRRGCCRLRNFQMAVHLYHLQKNYIAPDGTSSPVIDIESFDLKDGEQVALIGTSGSGKTTLLHMIAGILSPDYGEILFGNVDPAYKPAPASG